MLFSTPTVFAPRLKEAGYDFMSMANNHAFDFGQDGVNSTMHCLTEQGIAFAGIRDYPPSVVIERHGVKYGLCALATMVIPTSIRICKRCVR